MDILRAITETEEETKQKTEDIHGITTHDMFADLADKYGGPVYKFCRSLAFSKEDADDLFQETFLKVFEQPLKIKESDNPQSFLFSAALYIWKSWKRKYARRKRLAPVEFLDETTDNIAKIEKIASQTNIEEDFTEREEIQAVRNLVENLPEKLRIPIILYYTAEMNIENIALTLEIPEGTVKSRLFTARKIIKKGLI